MIMIRYLNYDINLKIQNKFVEPLGLCIINVNDSHFLMKFMQQKFSKSSPGKINQQLSLFEIRQICTIVI